MEIVGKVTRVIFENETNNYRIFLVKDREGNTNTFVGYTQRLDYDINYLFNVEEVENPRYGKQYQIINVTIYQENTREGIISYLTSSLFPGIGIIAAEAIYDELGDEALKIIARDYSSLDRVKKLSNKQKEVIYVNINKNIMLQDIFVSLFEIGISNELALRLYDKYGDNTLDIINENPYRLVYEFENIGFLKADLIAMKLGFSLDNEERLKASLIYTFFNLANKYGLTYLTYEQIIESDLQFLNKAREAVERQKLEAALNVLINEDRIINEKGRLYLPYLYFDEVNIAKVLNNFLSQKKDKVKKITFNQLIKDFEEINSIKLEDTQIEAIYNALENKVSIITGGPGTGKTTIIKAIIQLYCALNGLNVYDDITDNIILLCAPTGKGSKRINEQTLFKAQTIHRSLGYNFDGEYQYDQNNQLPHRLIIVDEASMIDNNLAAHLLVSIKSNAKVVFVGDVFQLPSISPGAFLSDIIESGKITTTYLHTIFRQKEKSSIIGLSEDIKQGSIDYNRFKNEDLLYVKALKERTPEVVNKIIEHEIEAGKDLMNDIAVLIPMYDGVSGINNINMEISKRFNAEPEFEVMKNNITYHQNDKIMCLVNSADWMLLNGDVGILEDKVLFNNNDKVVPGYRLNFDRQIVNIKESDLDSFNLAYATSIHKAQGSEYKVVIMVIDSSFRVLLKRKLLYTAVSRAKEKLYIVGDISMLDYGLQYTEKNRQTSLKERIGSLYIDLVEIKDDEIPFKYLGEQNMEGITPYYFMED